jgi:hypothetical protein
LKEEMKASVVENEDKANENVISGIGKILKYVNYEEELFIFWLSKMPIELDKEEAIVMNQFLSEIISTQPLLVIG